MIDMTQRTAFFTCPRIAIVLAVCFSCSALGADERESKARKYLLERVAAESQGAFKLLSVTKTNGYEGEQRLYVLEWEARLSVEKEVWKPGDAIGGYWNNFGVLLREPAGLDTLLAGAAKHLERGSRITLTGNCAMRKTDNGWRVESFEVKAGQLIADRAKTSPSSKFAGLWKVNDQEFLKITEMESGGFQLDEHSYSPHAASPDGMIWIPRGHFDLKDRSLEGVFAGTGGRWILAIGADGSLQSTIDDRFGQRTKKAVKVQ